MNNLLFFSIIVVAHFSLLVISQTRVVTGEVSTWHCPTLTVSEGLDLKRTEERKKRTTRNNKRKSSDDYNTTLYSFIMMLYVIVVMYCTVLLYHMVIYSRDTVRKTRRYVAICARCALTTAVCDSV